MSGLGNTSAGKTFVNQFKGNFTVRTNESDEEGVKRVNKIGKTVYEKLYNTLSGYITAINKEKHEEYGENWTITIEADGVDYTLNMPYTGRTTMGLFLRLPNLDLNKEVTLKLFYFEEEDKSAMTVYQDGEKIDLYWSKEDPKGLPQMEEKVVNGKDVWDSTLRMIYLEKYLDQKVMPRLKEAVGNRVVEPAVDQTNPAAEEFEGVDEPAVDASKVNQQAIDEMEDDDLPF